MLSPRSFKSIVPLFMFTLTFGVLGSGALSAQGQDADSNGFRDMYEQQIAARFCPCVFLNTTEYLNMGVNTRPSPVEIMTGQLWAECFSLNGSRFGEARYDELLGTDYSWIDDKNMSITYGSKATNCMTATNFYPRYHFDYAGTGSTCDFFGTYADLAAGASDGWYHLYKYGNEYTGPYTEYPPTVYAHLFTAWQEGQFHGKLVVQYWFFYPFDDWINDHEGDWEHIDVIVTSDDPSTASIECAWYYFHESCIFLEHPQVPGTQNFDFYVVDGTHPVVFVGGFGAKTYAGYSGAGYASHGCYPIWGPWSEVSHVPTINTTCDEGVSTEEDCHGCGTYHYVSLPGYPATWTPPPNWIHWKEFVHATRDNRYGVVLLKDPNTHYDPAKPWLKANIYWGHYMVHSFGDDYINLTPWGPDDVGNVAPPGPAYHRGWTRIGNYADEVHYYTMGLPKGWAHVSDAQWIPPVAPCYDTDTPVVAISWPPYYGGISYTSGQTIPISWNVSDNEYAEANCTVRMNYNNGNGSWDVLRSGIHVDANGVGHFNYCVPHGQTVCTQVWVAQVIAADACGGRVGSATSACFYVDLTTPPPKNDGPIIYDPSGGNIKNPDPVARRADVPRENFLSSPFPNPFNPSTSISFGLKAPAQVSLVIYNVKGSVVKTFYNSAFLAAGRYLEEWNGRNDRGSEATSGVYFLNLKVGEYSKTQRMVLLR